ncbi:MAG: hypothetical protein LIO44_00275 [Eubacterium sp.]|nr:hypothetical protein [Eubacterium sp.]
MHVDGMSINRVDGKTDNLSWVYIFDKNNTITSKAKGSVNIGSNEIYCMTEHTDCFLQYFSGLKKYINSSFTAKPVNV